MAANWDNVLPRDAEFAMRLDAVFASLRVLEARWQKDEEKLLLSGNPLDWHEANGVTACRAGLNAWLVAHGVKEGM